MENLRLACPECNKKRKKQFSFREILEFAESPRVAASCRELPPESNPIRIQSKSNPNTSKAAAPTRARFVKPSVEEVAAYCREKGYGIDAQRFVDYYDSNGWKVGKNPMQDWRATVRSWARRDGKDTQPAAVGAAKPSAVAMAAIQRMLEEEE